MTLEVVECKEVADRSVLPGLKEGTKVIAVHLRGTSDGKYEDYNEIYGMYLSVDPTGYLQCISSYDFEPYAQMLGVYPALDERALKGETSCDGWIGFLVPDWSLPRCSGWMNTTAATGTVGTFFARIRSNCPSRR